MTKATRLVHLIFLLALVCLLLVPLGRISAQDAAPSEAEKSPAGEKAKAKAKEKGQRLFDGQSLKPWKVAGKFDFENHGKVAVKEKAIVLERGRPATGIYYSGKLPRINYELQLEARRVDGSDFFCGLTFPYGETYCSWIVGGWGGGVVGLSNIDNMSAVENETTDYVDFKQNQWYQLRLRVTDEKIEAWIDDRQLVDLETEGRKLSIWWEQEPMRPLGIATWNTTAQIRNVTLRDLKTTEKEKE